MHSVWLFDTVVWMVRRWKTDFPHLCITEKKKEVAKVSVHCVQLAGGTAGGAVLSSLICFEEKILELAESKERCFFFLPPSEEPNVVLLPFGNGGESFPLMITIHMQCRL